MWTASGAVCVTQEVGTTARVSARRGTPIKETYESYLHVFWAFGVVRACVFVFLTQLHPSATSRTSLGGRFGRLVNFFGGQRPGRARAAERSRAAADATKKIEPN